MLFRIGLAVLLLMTSACASFSQPARLQPPDQAAFAFLEAFNAMDEDRFDRFFAEEVSMFFPDGPFPPGRIDGKRAVTAAFHRFFAMVRERGSSRLNIQPRRLVAVDHGNLALVSFELDGADRIGRRSILMRREPGGWRILHFHASSIDTGE